MDTVLAARIVLALSALAFLYTAGRFLQLLYGPRGHTLGWPVAFGAAMLALFSLVAGVLCLAGAVTARQWIGP